MIIPGYLERILRARVYDVAVETPLEPAPRLSRRLDNHVLIKREDLQAVFSFKLRGAYNKISALSPAERERGVITASAGNHAQGVALAAQRLGIRALIVMPTTTPRIKVDSVRALGGEAVLVGDAYDDAYAHARQLQVSEGMTYVHPYDDPDVIAGQGTIAMEILRQHQGAIDAIFVPVGGGGLLAGIAAYVKHLVPSVRVIGVEPDDAACLRAALDAGKRVALPHVGIFADGVAVRQIGEEPFRIAQQCVDDVLSVDTDAICAAIKDIFDETRSIAEPAGALGVAGLKAYVEREGLRGRTLIAIDSGANMNFDRLRHVAERAELGEQREALFAVTLPERQGAFRNFCQVLGAQAVTEFNYRYGDRDEAHVFVGVALGQGAAQRAEIGARLRAAGLAVIDMSQNEMAKLHVRFMVGGRALVEHERVFRFEFPERPGALLQFLTNMGGRWNISLFHYRNHGAAFGRVLAGMQIPPADASEFQRFLSELGYAYSEETDNAAYQAFLR
ncbi:MAG TPA: threonine ammonia-lyase, biosynthetic [Polyangiales bacterium]|nr:threonine ammonia-lyase, biosynthetic [Polyangiales bacterium]